MQPLSDPSCVHWPFYHWPLSKHVEQRGTSPAWPRLRIPWGCRRASLTPPLLCGVQVQYQGWSFMRFNCRWLVVLYKFCSCPRDLSAFPPKGHLETTTIPEENVLWFASQKILRRRFPWRAFLPVITDLIEIPIHIPRITYIVPKQLRTNKFDFHHRLRMCHVGIHWIFPVDTNLIAAATITP